MIDIFKRASVRSISSVVLVGAALAGCATMSSKPEEVVRARATQSWKAMVANDLDKAYAYTTPSYRAATPLIRYKSNFGGAVKWTDAEVASVKCETEDKCVAQMKVTAIVTMNLRRGSIPPIVNYFDETWLRENGQWWLFPTP